VSPFLRGEQLHLGPRPRILLVRLSAIGDVVVTTPVTRALREALPDAYVAWVVEEKSADLLMANPYLDEVIIWPRSTWRQLRGPARYAQQARFLADLRRRRFGVAIDFQGLARSAWLTFVAGARHRVGNTRTREGSGLFYTIRVPRPSQPGSRQRCLDLLRPLGIESQDRRMVVAVTPEDRQFATTFLERHGLTSGVQAFRRSGIQADLPERLNARTPERLSYVCLCPATTWANKHWLEERWAALADALRERLGLLPVFMGTRADLPMLERIRAAMRVAPTIAAGETSLRGAAALLEGARAVVSVDTALMHIGVAVGTPTVGLCGPSFWPGFEDYEGFRLIRKPVPCSPCLRHPTCAHFDCMRAIGVGETVQAVAELTGQVTQPLLRVVG
jgi:heptosyltransferase-1